MDVEDFLGDTVAERGGDRRVEEGTLRYCGIYVVC